MNIYSLFEKSASKFPDDPCLVIDKITFSYSEVQKELGLISNLLVAVNKGEFVAVLTEKSLATYSGILGILKAGFGYVPLNSKFPVKKNRLILQESNVSTIIVDKYCLELVKSLTKTGNYNVIIPDCSRTELQQLDQNQNVNYFTSEDLAVAHSATESKSNNKYAYLLFTSGSTGIPKGVPVRHTSVLDYVKNVQDLYSFKQTDRFSQIFELTFDLSVHDLFICFAVGGSLFIPPRKYFSPLQYITKNAITIWFSVPSFIGLIIKNKIFQPNLFPSIRKSFFCGEALPASFADNWQILAPNSEISNLYGPTEATIAISNYIKKPNQQDKTRFGFLCIGKIFSNQQYCLINEEGKVAETGESGELHLAGTQLTHGYWNNKTATEKSFVTLPGSSILWYKTGDLMVSDAEKDLFYITRKDFQAKIRGFRVELEEINCIIKDAFQYLNVISLPVLNEEKLYDKIYTYIETDEPVEEERIQTTCKDHLPYYMVPDKVFFMTEFPLNANGKIDRGALMEFSNELI